MTGAPTAPLTTGGAAPDRARAGLVLVHGRGGSAQDILGLGTALALPDLALIAPQAPGHSWWPSSFLAETATLDPHVQSGLAAIDTAIAALEAGGLPRARIALAGFSQGGCLALEYAARRGGLLAAFGLSAGLVGTGETGEAASPALYGHPPKRFDYATRLDHMPVHISVHAEDPHIPLARARQSAEVFVRLGADARLHVTPGPGHGITQGDITALRGALNL